jgi:hypothetical protein
MFLSLLSEQRIAIECTVADKEQKQINHRDFFSDQMVSTEDINELLTSGARRSS